MLQLDPVCSFSLKQHIPLWASFAHQFHFGVPDKVARKIPHHILCASVHRDSSGSGGFGSWGVSSPHCTKCCQIALQRGCESLNGLHTHTNTWQKSIKMDNTSLMGITWDLIISTCVSLSAGKFNSPLYSVSCSYLLLVHVFCLIFK